MNQGSIESRSSAASAVELGGLRAPTVRESNRSDFTTERFDSIFDNLQRESQPQSRTVDRNNDKGLYREEPKVDSGRGGQREIESEPKDGNDNSLSEKPVEVEGKAVDSETLAKDQSESVGSETQAESENKTSDVVAEGDGKSLAAQVSDKSADAVAVKVPSKQNDSEPKPASQLKSTDGTKGKGEENSAVRTVVEGKVGTSKSFTLQTKKVTIEKNGKAAAIVQKPAQVDAKSKVSAGVENANAKVDVESGIKIAKPAASAKVDSKVAISPKAESEGSVKADAKTVPVSKLKENLAGQLDQPAKSAVKKGVTHSAKTSVANRAPLPTADTTTLKNSLKAAGLQVETRMKTLDSEIGIKAAQHASNNVTKMSVDSKSSETQPSEKGFLKESSDTGALNRAQAVNSRSDSGGFSNQSHHGHGQGSHSDNSNSGRGSEQFRQWVENNTEVKGVSHAAHQTELVDRTVGSLLSARVLNQIVNHIERMRDSEKNRVKVSLGSEANGVTVDIRIDGGSIFTTFEGDPEILDELREQWGDIKKRASRKGVALQDPEFSTKNISYSSSSESESFLPDGGIAKEDMSKSVIQHDNNQPVRPVEMTAVAGSSGPVHSYA